MKLGYKGNSVGFYLYLRGKEDAELIAYLAGLEPGTTTSDYFRKLIRKDMEEQLEAEKNT